MNVTGLAGDRGEHHFRRGNGEVSSVMLTDTKEIDAMLISEDRLGDDVANDLRVRFGRAVGALRNVTESVETQFKGKIHDARFVDLDYRV
jgi:predicted nucleic acid-binding protein